MRLLRACGLVALRQVASGSVRQGLLLENGKMGSQIVGKDQS